MHREYEPEDEGIMTVDSRRLEVSLFGQDHEVSDSPEATARALRAGRLALGWIFLFAGIEKLGVDSGRHSRRTQPPYDAGPTCEQVDAALPATSRRAQ
jgi:hypothetical protein